MYTNLEPRVDQVVKCLFYVRMTLCVTHYCYSICSLTFSSLLWLSWTLLQSHYNARIQQFRFSRLVTLYYWGLKTVSSLLEDSCKVSNTCASCDGRRRLHQVTGQYSNGFRQYSNGSFHSLPEVNHNYNSRFKFPGLSHEHIALPVPYPKLALFFLAQFCGSTVRGCLFWINLSKGDWDRCPMYIRPRSVQTKHDRSAAKSPRSLGS